MTDQPSGSAARPTISEDIAKVLNGTCDHPEHAPCPEWQRVQNYDKRRDV